MEPYLRVSNRSRVNRVDPIPNGSELIPSSVNVALEPIHLSFEKENVIILIHVSRRRMDRIYA